MWLTRLFCHIMEDSFIILCKDMWRLVYHIIQGYVTDRWQDSFIILWKTLLSYYAKICEDDRATKARITQDLAYDVCSFGLWALSYTMLRDFELPVTDLKFCARYVSYDVSVSVAQCSARLDLRFRLQLISELGCKQTWSTMMDATPSSLSPWHVSNSWQPMRAQWWTPLQVVILATHGSQCVYALMRETFLIVADIWSATETNITQD